jgi:hypothetical protein
LVIDGLKVRSVFLARSPRRRPIPASASAPVRNDNALEDWDISGRGEPILWAVGKAMRFRNRLAEQTNELQPRAAREKFGDVAEDWMKLPFTFATFVLCAKL